MKELEFHVAGFSHSNPDGGSRQHLLRRLSALLDTDVALELRRDPNNPHDRNAIAVWAGVGQLGFVPRAPAIVIAPIMDSGVEVRVRLIRVETTPKGGYRRARVRVAYEPPRSAPGRGGRREHVDAQAEAARTEVAAGSGCVTAETLVATPLGLKPIGVLVPGDKVWAWSISQATMVPTSILRVLVHREKAVVRVSFESGRRLHGTPCHLVHTSRGWSQFRSLRRGDLVWSVDDGVLTVEKVVSAAPCSDSETVFNLQLNAHHIWLSSGVVSCSFSWLPQLRIALADLSAGRSEGLLLRANFLGARSFDWAGRLAQRFGARRLAGTG